MVVTVISGFGKWENSWLTVEKLMTHPFVGVGVVVVVRASPNFRLKNPERQNGADTSKKIPGLTPFLIQHLTSGPPIDLISRPKNSWNYVPYVNLKMWQHGAHNCLIYNITRSFIYSLHCCEIDNIIDEESNFFPDQNFGSTLFRISLSLNLYILLTHLISYGVLRSCIVAINTLPQ